jgi:F-type H+-transporting ATPase subunit epsilon
MTPDMTLRILLPQGDFSQSSGVTRIVAETLEGSFGILPRRLDCVAALAPGILVHETAAGGEVLTAIDEGLLVKIGAEVTVSVRRAIGGTDLANLRDRVRREFLAVSEDEQNMLTAMAKLEVGLLRRLEGVHHD